MFAEDTARDVRVGLRMLSKERGFCALAVIVLALGIAAVTTQFSMIDGIMLRGFPFPNADRLTGVNFIDPTTQTVFGANGRLTSMDYEELVPRQKSFELMTAFLNGSTVNMTVNREPRRYTGAYVTDTFLRVLSVAPLMGRDFTPADNRPGAETVAIIGYAVWQRDFGGAANVVGTTVRLNGKPATIIGVMPQGFAFPTNEELWIPLYTEFPVLPRNDPQANSPSVVGLRKPGVTVGQAQTEFDTIARRFAAAYPDTNKAFDKAQVEPLIDQVTGVQLRGTMWTMLAFCVGVLLIACVNVMNMQFARATLRARELAVRSAVGATRGRLIRQMVTESALLAGGGAVIGVALAYGSLDWLTATLRNWDNPPPTWMTFQLDGAALACTVAATAVAALMSGLLPAWMASRARIVDVLREGGRGSTGRGVGLVTRGLVVGQIVVTCVLLIGSLLQLRSLLAQQRIDYGYDTRGVMTARMGLMDGDYPTSAARRIFYDRLLRQLDASGQFESVAFSSRLRMVFAGTAPIEIEGKVYQDRRDRPTTNVEQVTGGYFATIGQKLLEGRTFSDDDLDTKQPVAIVNAAFARKHFGAASPIGRRFRTGDGVSGPYSPWRTIVGVVATVRMMGPFDNPNVDDSGFYVPLYASPIGPAPDEPVAPQFTTVVARPHRGQQAEAVIGALRREVAKADPNLPIYFVGTPDQNLAGFTSGTRLLATMFTIFGGVAIVLAAVGIFGMMSFSVNQRQQEFGVRMALGADRRRILGMVLGQGARQVVVGLAVGLGLSLAIAAFGRDAIGSMLFGVSALDPATYVAVATLVAVVSLVAVLVPARRATRVDPMLALRAE